MTAAESPAKVLESKSCWLSFIGSGGKRHKRGWPRMVGLYTEAREEQHHGERSSEQCDGGWCREDHDFEFFRRLMSCPEHMSQTVRTQTESVNLESKGGIGLADLAVGGNERIPPPLIRSQRARRGC